MLAFIQPTTVDKEPQKDLTLKSQIFFINMKSVLDTLSILIFFFLLS